MASKETVVLVPPLSPTMTTDGKSKEEKKNRSTNDDSSSSPRRRHWREEAERQDEVVQRRKDPWITATTTTTMMMSACSLGVLLAIAVCIISCCQHSSMADVSISEASSIGMQRSSTTSRGVGGTTSTLLLARWFLSSSPTLLNTTAAGGAQEEEEKEGGRREKDSSSGNNRNNNNITTTTTKVAAVQQQQRRPPASSSSSSSSHPAVEEKEAVTSGDNSATTTGNEQCTKKQSSGISSGSRGDRRLVDAHGSYYYYTMDELNRLLRQVDDDVRNNRDGGRRWVRPELLPPLLQYEQQQQHLNVEEEQEQDKNAYQQEGEEEGKEEEEEEDLFSSSAEEEEMMIPHPYRGGGYNEYLEQKEKSPTSSGISSPETFKQKKKEIKKKQPKRFITVKRREQPPMAWEAEWNALQRNNTAAQDIIRPAVDYTDPAIYEYPDVEDAILQVQQQEDPPAVSSTEGRAGYNYNDDYYPSLERLGDMLHRWPTDRDYPDDVITETLYHFNYSNVTQRQAAERYRDIAKVPFKVYDVPDLTTAGLLWTDDYVSQQFDQQEGRSSANDNSSGSDNHDVVVDDKEDNRDDNHTSSSAGGGTKKTRIISGHAEESPNNFFAYYKRNKWNLTLHGLAPVRTNDWTYDKWSQHAEYADATRLSPDKPHFYWQSGTKEDERYYYQSEQSFVSRDLKFFSQTRDNFFVFDVDSSKGIQCRFGERGVTTANHYDSGRNMVAMITGAKRYILAPPNQCGKLGIGTDRESHIFRHSHLNLAHLSDDDIGNDENNEMSDEERAWLRRASDGLAVETVVKAGEVLYIPSHWFHYIISLQKSAQCNSRSGMDREGTVRFGGLDDVETCRS